MAQAIGGEQKRECRIGLVGAGNISALHLEGMERHRDRVKAVAMCDPDSDMLGKRAADHGIPATYARVEDMVAEEKLDAAIVCTPTSVRSAVVQPLIAARIPVLCEKPFGETYAEAMEMEEAARAAGVPLAINQNFRRHFGFALGREVLASGRLGPPLHLMHTAACLRRDKGWRLDRKRYVMAVMSIHWFDGYRFLLDDEADEVYCKSICSPDWGVDADTAISMVITFRKGTVVCLSESFSSFGKPGCCVLDCARGALQLGYETIGEINAQGDKMVLRNPYDKAEATYLILADLLDAAATGREPETSGRDNLNAMRMMEAAYRSIEQQRPVAVEEIQ